MSARKGWVFGPPPFNPNSTAEAWAQRHRDEGHHPYPAPTKENPERWECKCDPDAKWTAVWRMLTVDQIRQKFAHLSKRDTPARRANQEAAEYIKEIQAEQEQKNAALPIPSGPPLRIADQYAAGRKHG
jgi:hypothetical protein